MGRTPLILDTPGAIRRVLQRVCRDRGRLTIQRHHVQRSTILQAEAPDRLLMGLEDRDAEALGLAKGALVEVALTDRGRAWQGVTTVLGSEGGLPVWFLALPRMLNCLNPEAFLDHAPDPPLPCTFETLSHDVRDGLALGLSEEGIELGWTAGHGEGFRLEVPLAASLTLGPGERVVLHVVPCYLTDRAAGLRLLPDTDPAARARYLAWVRERMHEDHQHEAAVFEDQGLQAPREGFAPATGNQPPLRMLVNHAPLILVVAEQLDLATHFAHVLGRKFGFAWLDWLKGPLGPRLAQELGAPWGGFRLILVHQRLRLASGYDLVRQLVTQEACPLPILMVGSEVDLDLRRNRAIAAGAVDCLPVEPFHVLTVMKALEETLRLFG